jgi:hypothetical protein
LFPITFLLSPERVVSTDVRIGLDPSLEHIRIR